MGASLSYVHPTPESPWGTYLSQVDRVVPYLGPPGALGRNPQAPQALAHRGHARSSWTTARSRHFEGFRVQHIAHARARARAACATTPTSRSRR
jgi:glutamate dehydrogenase (NAD(P)+)